MYYSSVKKFFKYVSCKGLKEFSKDFKAVYKGINEEEVLENLTDVQEKWGNKYSYAIKSWKVNWDVLSPFFKYTPKMRTIMYTINIMEGFYRRLGKATKTKTMFLSVQALEKRLCLAGQNAIKKWPQGYRSWDLIINQLTIFFDERLNPYF